jgi:hypothetical protein
MEWINAWGVLVIGFGKRTRDVFFPAKKAQNECWDGGGAQEQEGGTLVLSRM